ncbi:nuclear transport factor 2 family protein [Streptomyces olivochromogenes]|uniref:nuclear transport factor 2 family protein n=1 Tax=Streptomyces olivochromogenes TaxID=1963 RepID=UPI0036D8086F
MPPTPSRTDREDILQVHHAYLDAMVEGDTQSLDDLLDDGFFLTHMTGYVQPKAEWLAQMRAGQFVYHSIDEVDTALDIDGGTARLTVRTKTDAKVYGSRADWRLLLATDYARGGDAWIPMRTVATTW